MKTIADLTADQLRKAAQIKEQIASLENQMQALFGPPAPPPRKKGELSAAGRARISAALKARWAKKKADEQGQSASKPAPAAAKASPKRKTMSAAQKAKIAATMRARWARIRAAKGSSKK